MGCWLPGSRTTGWAELCLGGARPVSYTLGPEAGWRVAGPEASRRHVRHASRRAEGLASLRLAYFESEGAGPAGWLGARSAWAELLSRTEGLGHVRQA